ncbi:unnamed protein product [Ophioblennius macclurei]
MTGRWTLMILALFLNSVMSKECPIGFTSTRRDECEDIDECASGEDYDGPSPCQENAVCSNTNGSFHCQCEEGFRSSDPMVSLSAESSTVCDDINECLEIKDLCGPHASCFNAIPNYSCICDEGFVSSNGAETFRHGSNVTCGDIDECREDNVCGEKASCVNTQGSYYCSCNAGFRLKSGNTNFSGGLERCEDICAMDRTTCGNGTCHQGASGHYCACHSGFTNYGNEKSRCTKLDCDVFNDVNDLNQNFHRAQDLMKTLKKTCVKLTESEDPVPLDGLNSLRRLLDMIDDVLSVGVFRDNRKVSVLLGMSENALEMVSPFIKTPRMNMSSLHTELNLMVHQGPVSPHNTDTFSTTHAQLDIHLETAAGDPSDYPGFTTVALLSYSNLEDSTDGFFGELKPKKGQSFKINSKVVTVAVSNSDTSHLEKPVNITLYHLTKTNQSTCVFWNSLEDGGAWSDQGCQAVESNQDYTVCSCTHLSSFAVLMALYEMEDKLELHLITLIGLSLSLVCLLVCILTFSLIRAIKSPRTTIHLHLCISLFIANLIFLTSISRTENRVGCAVVAGLLHYFFLASLCWMCLEGIQLFRMVILVFNTNFKTIYMMAGGYGIPAVIVAVTALVNAKGYGTPRHCWLSQENIWSFFGPACVIIIINVFFFLITVWKLAQKFASLNPDLNNLQKIKTFTITAVAQLCVLGTMWVFGCFQFEESNIVMSYLFTVFGSLQGLFLFVVHCLLTKQVREEYQNILSRCCAPRKKSYSEFSYFSKAHASKSSQDTGESHI